MSIPVSRRAVLCRSLLLALALVPLACNGAEPKPSRAVEAAPTKEPAAEDQLLVFAATSLRDVFAGLGKQFDRAHPGVHTTFNFAGTQELRVQIEQGAPADVFASADQWHMEELQKTSFVLDRSVFARNEPVLVIAQEAAGTLRAFADLPQAKSVVIGASEVPIGRYTLQILDKAQPALGADFRQRVEAKVVSRELNVRQVLTKVTLGEAQAGVVYRTDVAAAQGKVTVLPIPKEFNVVAEYPIAALRGAPHPKLGAAWVAFVLSDAGQAALRDAGFEAPAGSVSVK
jgi:molybdate transport system substrate-binding protein